MGSWVNLSLLKFLKNSETICLWKFISHQANGSRVTRRGASLFAMGLALAFGSGLVSAFGSGLPSDSISISAFCFGTADWTGPHSTSEPVFTLLGT